MEAEGGRKYPRTEQINMAEMSDPSGRSWITQYMESQGVTNLIMVQDGFVYASDLILGESRQLVRHVKMGKSWFISGLSASTDLDSRSPGSRIHFGNNLQFLRKDLAPLTFKAEYHFCNERMSEDEHLML